MTPLRRARREVYRVYAEHEFLVRAADDEDLAPPAIAGGDSKTLTLAGATVLLAAAGALGGLIAIAGLSSAPGARRRVAARMLVSGGSPVLDDARVPAWRTPMGSDVHVLRRNAARRRRVGGARAAASVRATVIGRRAAASVRAAVGAALASSARVDVLSPAGSDQLAARATAHSQRSGQTEFGFER